MNGIVFAGIVYSVLCLAWLLNVDDHEELYEQILYEWKEERKIRSRSNTIENIGRKAERIKYYSTLPMYHEEKE